MKAMESIQDLIEEAKLRTVWWALCIFAVSYFLSHTSKSMWMNIPIAILFVSALRILFNEVDFRWKDRSVRLRTHLSHLEKKQLSVNDSRLSTMPPPPKWKRKIDSPVVEAAMNDFIDKILMDFVVDLWYSEITPDSEFPQHIHAIVMDALGEISGRVKELNLVDLLTRDIVDLIGNHLDTFRRNQAAIGIEVMETLSSEERDERLKHHLMASKELHPALISPESEYKVLQRLIGGVLAVVLRPREAQSPLIRSIARELVTCLVVQPVMNFACPAYINELIEYLLLAAKDDNLKGGSSYHSTNEATHPHDHPLASGGVQDVDSTSRKHLSSNQGTDTIMAKLGNQRETSLDYSTERPTKYQSADWARMLEAATQRRTEVLTPENLENLWTKGRNYKKKEQKNIKVGSQDPIRKGSGINCAVSSKDLGKEMLANRHEMPMGKDEVGIKQLSHRLTVEDMLSDENETEEDFSQAPNKEFYFEGGNLLDVLEHTSSLVTDGNRHLLKRSNSTSALIPQPDTEKKSKGGHGGPIISEFYGPNFGQHSGEYSGKTASDVVLHSEAQQVPKLKCRVMGAYFEKLGSKSFAVYSIAVTDAENKTWFVKRRYRNFERLHRHLKDIPNYTLHLPPKRIFSSSTEDAFVHQRCIQLDKYLQDLLSIANVAEQHEVWDFLSVSSKNYSFGKSSSVMRTLAVNVDDAVDDIVRQFRGVSDGLVRKVVGPSPSNEASSSATIRNLPWNVDEINRHISSHYSVETTNSFSDNDEGHKDENDVLKEVNSVNASGWHSDNEVNSKSFPPRVIKHSKEPMNSSSEKRHDLMVKSGIHGGGFPVTSLISDHLEDPVGMPPEWTPPNVSVPLLNLVDNIFQLKRRGWLRRQVFWISKQILQLIMEDAIDDWLLRQIHWLRRDEIIAQGIQWIQDILWPDGTFFLRVRNTPSNDDDTEPHQKPFQTTNQFGGSKVSSLVSFEQQLQAARRASDVKKMLFDGAPTALVSLIGQKQYRRCARDIYYFTQSSICVKNLAYEALELLLVSVFPELTTLVRDVHGKMSITRPI